jgi:uncharacterized protein (DUF2141 family)
MACISGFTLGGYYEYIDCCGYNQTGLSSGLEEVCVDQAYSATSIGVLLDSGSTCTISCNLGELSYNFTVTGTCDALSGSTLITGYGGIPPYTIDNIIHGTISAQTSSSPMLFTGLTGGTYVFRLNDSLGLQNNELYINVTISDCFTANIFDTSGTTCGLDNGSFSVSATSLSGPYTIILYKDNVFYDLVETNTLPYNVISLPDGIYYATIYDNGSTTANTENVIVNSSVGVDFGFWKVNTSNCLIDKGKLSVTGVTGNGPFTYLWSTNETTQTITGLTAGTYSCIVTDSNGCTNTKSEVVGLAQPLGLAALTSTNPTCFSSDGTMTFTISGGSAPFFYSADTNEIGYTLSDTFTISNLASGTHFVLVRDANLCEIIVSGFISPINGFNVVGTSITNSNCNSNNGSLYVQLQGSQIYYTYLLSGQTSGILTGNTSMNQNYSFNGLPNDNYLLVISGTGTDCSYFTNLTISSVDKFTLDVTSTGSTCWQNNGVINVNVNSGYTGVLDYILSDGQSIIDTNLTSYTFNNLAAGTYTLSVVDQSGCTVSETITILSQGALASTINTIGCTSGNDGQAEVVIFQGEPTFTYDWSDNVCCSQTGDTVTGLTAGTYSVIVTDNNGCTQLNNFSISCNSNISSGYTLYNICNDFFTTTVGAKRGFLEMLGEGYLDITSGYTGCSLNSAEYICNLEVSGVSYTQSFYTGYTSSDVPSDALWKSTIESILDTIPEVDSYTVDPINNVLQIVSVCSGDTNALADQQVKLYLTINFDVVCQEEVFPCPETSGALLVNSTTYFIAGPNEYLQYVDP